MSIAIYCVCGQKLEVSDNAAGTNVKCLRCGKILKSPVPSNQSPRVAQTDSKHATEYFVKTASRSQGPFPLAKLAELGITGETLVWHSGMGEWTPAARVPALQAVLAKGSPPLSLPATRNLPDKPSAETVSQNADPKQPSIALSITSFGCGLVGILAICFWPPFAGLLGIVSIALGVIALAQTKRRGTGFAVTGLIVGFSTVAVVLIWYFMPLDPRQVCEKFSSAATEQEMKKYTTANLWPALNALNALATQSETGASSVWELTGEEPAPTNTEGYVVGFRLLSKDSRIEGIFHLVQRSGEWKIEEIYLVAWDQQPVEFALSRDYQLLLDAARTDTSLSRQPAPAGQQGQKQWYEDPKVVRNAARGSRTLSPAIGKVGKGALVVLAALVAGIAALWRKLKGQPASNSVRTKG